MVFEMDKKDRKLLRFWFRISSSETPDLFFQLEELFLLLITGQFFLKAAYQTDKRTREEHWEEHWEEHSKA